MKASTSVLLVAVGLFVLWLAATGRLNRFGPAWDYLNNGTGASPTTAKPTASSLPSALPPLPNLT